MAKRMETKKISESVSRQADGIPCECGGYADRVDCTPEEMEEYNCSEWKSWECCARAFLCRICKKRLVGRAEAPDMD